MNFSNMNVGTRLALGFSGLIAIMLAVAGVGTYTARQQAAVMTRAVDVDMQYSAYILRLRTAVANMRRYEKDVLLNVSSAEQVKEYMQKWHDTRKRAGEHLQEATRLAASDEERGRLKQMGVSLIAYERGIEGLNAGIGLGQIKTPEQGYRKIGESRQVIRETETLTQELFEASLKQMSAIKPAIERAEHQRQINVGVGIAVVLLLAVGSGVLITRSIVRPLKRAVEIAEGIARGDLAQTVEVTSKDEIGRLMFALKGTVAQLGGIVGGIKEASDKVNAASREIAQANIDLSTRTEEQASALEETSASMQQMTATVGQTAQNARQANEVAAQASSVAAKGGDAVRVAVGTMNGIAESSKRIAEIIGVIDGIAFQTNILALNAAVEAARAGDQGRGFAVVASEVRSLAQRSAGAAKEIKVLITDSAEKVEAGSRQVNDAGRTMDEIVVTVKQVSTLIAEITKASQEQAQGIGQVSEAMTQLEQVTQENAAMVEEASAAAASLEDQSGAMAQAISAFRLHAPREQAAALQKPSGSKARAIAHSGGRTVQTHKAALPAAGATALPKAAQDVEAWEQF